MKVEKTDILKLTVSIIACLMAGAFGSVFTFSSIPTWYASLNKPFFTPPNWLFGPAWTTLYILMGIALFLVWNKGFKDKEPKLALYVFSIQLILNAAWSFLFFGLRSPLLGLAGIIPLWVSILLTIWRFWKIDKRAGALLIPYLVWVSFATALNYAVLAMN